MIIKIKCILLSCFLFHYAVASVPVYKDSAIHPKEFHLSQQQFLEKYGNDDTSRALIRYYFRRTIGAKRNTIIFGSAGLLSSIAFDRLIVNGTPSREPLVGIGFVLFLGLMIYVSAIIVLLSILIWILFSKKTLMKQLQKYRTGTPMPNRIKRNFSFKKYLKEEENGK